MNYFLSITLSAFFIIFSGCAPRAAMFKVDHLVATGHYKEAAQLAQKEIDKGDKYARDNLLWNLESGQAYLCAKDDNASITAFDRSEDLIAYYKEQTLKSDISQTLSSMLLNDTTRPYKGTEYDGVMANTYKAINYLAQGDRDGARVEFNRAIDRQRRAKIYFSEMIQKEQEALAAKEQEAAQKGQNLQADDAQIESFLTREYPELRNFQAYPDFINPMTSYLAGIFAKTQGESSKAEFLLKEAYAMLPHNKDLQYELENLENKASVWVIFENGQAPILQELRADIPMWIFTDRVSYISIALPKLVERDRAYDYLKVKIDENTTIETKYLSSMENVIKTEFVKNYPSRVRRSILSAATKTAINYALQEHTQNSGSATAAFVSFAAAVYQITSTQADTRIWTTLPKEFQLARFDKPNKSAITLLTPNNQLIKNIELPEADNILIYVKIATPSALASVRVIPF